MSVAHGTERSRKLVTEVFEPIEAETTDGHRFMMPTGGHTYTQTEKFCKNCGWVTCNGIIGGLFCPGCTEQW